MEVFNRNFQNSEGHVIKTYPSQFIRRDNNFISADTAACKPLIEKLRISRITVERIDNNKIKILNYKIYCQQKMQSTYFLEKIH